MGAGRCGEGFAMGDNCELRAANGVHDHECDGSDCVFWRAVSHLGESEASGCAITHYQMLGDERTAAWLLSVKERLERDSNKSQAAR
jgi:hypothetical protein